MILCMNSPRNMSCKIHSVKSVQIRIFFLPVFSCIRTEYEDLHKCPYSVWIQENTEQKKSAHGHFSCIDNVQKLMFRSSLLLLSFCWIFICLTLLCYTMEISNVKFYTFMQGNAFLFDKDAARIFLLFNYKFFAALFNSFKWHQLLFDFCKWCG